MITIDGSQKSGSGTIVRYSVGLASLLGKELLLTNIRKKRSKPGLRPQHFKAVQACCEMTKGKIQGLEVSSNEIRYKPGKKISGGTYLWDIGTAGSTTMLAQTILPLACFADSPSKITIIGGLFQDFAPAAHHLQHVVFPLYQRMGIDVSIEIERPGYVPTGGGIIHLKVKPVKSFKPLQMITQGTVEKIEGIALASHLDERNVSDRMADQCQKTLKAFNYEGHFERIYDTTAQQQGASLTAYATTNTGCIIGADLSGKPGRTSEQIGHKVAEMLLEDIQKGATVDRHTADQLILFAAMANGNTEYLIPFNTEHIETNLWLVEKILGISSKLINQHLTIYGQPLH